MGILDNPVLETRHLRLIVALVDEGTTSRAAAVLHLTQSAVSHQLTELERRLGVALFARVGKRLELSPAGTELVGAARKLLSDVVKAEVSLRAHAAAPRRRVRVSTECYTCYHWLPRVIREFRSEHPDVDIQIDLEATRRPVGALLSGDLDIAIAAGTKRSARLVETKLFPDEFVCIMAPTHPLAARKWITSEDFANVQLFTYDVPSEELRWMHRPPMGPITPRSVSRVPLTEAIVELVAAGLGISVFARWAVAPQLQNGSLVARPLTRRGLKRTWSALHRRRATPDVTAFVKAIARSSKLMGAATATDSPRR